MKRMLLILLAACGPETFFVIPPPASDGSDAAIGDAAAEAESDGAALEDVREAGSDVSPEAAPDAPPPVCDPGDVTHAGKCFYLDGSGGVCSSGYTLSSDAALAAVLAGNANAFQGKNYRATVSANCCVFTVDAVRNYGMVSHCNVPGPFGAGEPKYGGNGCLNVSVAVKPNHLTLCERAL